MLKNEYWAVNWKNGMKINHEHFLQERRYHAFVQSLGVKTGLNEYNFGISTIDGNPGLSYRLYNNRFMLDKCHGVTSGGWIIYINEEISKNIDSLDVEEIRKASSVNDEIQIFIELIPSEILCFGKIDGESFPIRLPDSSFAYKLSYQYSNSDKLIENYTLKIPIAKLHVTQGGVDVVESYIPPCSQVMACQKLYEYFQAFSSCNISLAKATSNIIQNLTSGTNSSKLSRQTIAMCQNLTLFLANEIDRFATVYKSESPIEVFLFYKRLSRLINASLVNIENRSEMVRVMADWANMTEKEFMKTMDTMGSLQYSHLDIQSFIKEVDSYIQMIIKMFSVVMTKKM